MKRPEGAPDIIVEICVGIEILAEFTVPWERAEKLDEIMKAHPDVFTTKDKERP